MTQAPLHRRPRMLLLVCCGGSLGTLARWAVSEWLSPPSGTPGGWPVGTLAVNLAGVFALGLLLEALLRIGPDTGRRRAARLLLGTGFLGAFTTMSALGLETVLLADDGRSLAALSYLCGSVVGGAVLAWAGVLLGARLAGRRAVAR